MEPIVLYSRMADLAAVARRLRETAPDVSLNGPDEAWTEAVATFDDEGGRKTLTLSHDPEYDSGPGWVEQMSGMSGYLGRFPQSPRKSIAVSLPTTFRFALATRFNPDFDPEGDPRLDVLFAVAEAVDGVLFTPSSIRDAQGRILFSAEGPGEEDPNAMWPLVVGEVDVATTPGRTAEGFEDEDADPPDARRVALRALAMAALCGRARLEQAPFWRRLKVASQARTILAWARDVGVDSEWEPAERAVVGTAVGRLDDVGQIESTWRLEGLVVLAWALDRAEIPPHDQLVDPTPLVVEGLNLFDAVAARELLDSPSLRPRDEIKALQGRLFAIHWRLRNFRLHPEVMDFAEFARTCWFGPIDISGLPLIDGDLAIHGRRLDRASHAELSEALSAAMERHQAANWLCDGPQTYSEASIAT